MQENDPVVKRKKGRPRKQQPEESTQETKDPPEKKKRGRKKKEVQPVEEVKPKKKRGRKAAVKYFSSSIRKQIPLTTVIQDSNNYILHLDAKDINENKIVSDCLPGKRDATDITVAEVFEQLQNEADDHESYDVQQELEKLLENDDNILSDYLENEEEKDLRNLYERRIQFRESQDQLLVKKLESMHKDDKFLDDLVSRSQSMQMSKRDEVAEEGNQGQHRKEGYFEVLHEFVHNADWLTSTDAACWWCCHQFDTLPLGLPVSFDESRKKFRTKGVFCSFACVAAYKNDNKMHDTEWLLRYLHKLLTGEAKYKFIPAPPRCALKLFGGILSIEEFRRCEQDQKMYRLIEYPMFVSRDYVEEVDLQKIKRVNSKLFNETPMSSVKLDDKRIEDAKLRISKLEKSTVVLGNTIDRFIKFS